MKKLLYFLFSAILIFSNTPFVALGQEISPSPVLSPQETQIPAQDLTQQTIQKLPDLSSSSSAQINSEDSGIVVPYPDFSNTPNQSSATTKVFPIIRNLSKRSFRANERVNVIVDNAENETLGTIVFDSDGKEINLEMFTITEGAKKTVVIIPPTHLKPGKYTIKVTTSDGQTYTQDFTWGVLVINTNKSIYLSSKTLSKEGLPPETAKLAMAVLDEKGEMVCNAALILKIKSPISNIEEELSTQNGKIKVNPACQKKGVALEPDYEATYKIGSEIGKYQMNLTAQTKNGTYSIDDLFEVRDFVPFDVERSTATRIFPPLPYPVDLNITANQDFEGTVTEVVPANFALSPSLSSDVSFTTQEASQTSLDTFLSSDSAHLGLPYDGYYPISQEFGEQLLRDPQERNLYASFNLAGHDGVDFDLPSGTPILAADSGKVSLSGQGAYGITIVIDHSWGRSYYGHLSFVKVKVGDEVKKGDEIGLSGDTGLSTGPHLHFGMKPNNPDMQNGYYGKIDPLPFLGLQSQQNNQLKLISFNIKVKKGDKINLGYFYKAPNISPQFYNLGPLRFYQNGNKVFEEIRQWQIASDDGESTHMLLFWNPANDPKPSGWSVVSTYDGRFPRGEAVANVLTTGGVASHTPTVSSVTKTTSAQVGPGTGGSAADLTAHAHGTLTGTPTSANNLPVFRSLQLIRYDNGIPSTIPQNAIAVFDAAPSGSWSRETSQDSNMVRINSTVATGGANTHTHTVAWTGLTTAASAAGAAGATTNLGSGATTHTNPVDSATPSVSSLPPYIQVLMYKATANISPVPTGLIAMFDGEPGSRYSKLSESGGAFYQQFVQGASSYNGTSQGSASHDHANLTSGNSGAATNAQRVKGTSGGTGTAAANHTHTMTASFTAGDSNLPQYVNVVYAKKLDSPDLTQIHYRWRNDDGSETTATWKQNEDTATSIEIANNARIRFEISNEGTATATSITYRADYGVRVTTCAAITAGNWFAIPTGTTEKLQIYDSSNLTDGEGTTAQLTAENSTFVAGEVKDTGNTTSGITLTTSQYTELEYSIKVTSNAVNGEIYCLRVSDAGTTTNFVYTQYGQVTVGASGPTLDQLMRHGKWFNNGVVQPFTF